MARIDFSKKLQRKGPVPKAPVTYVSDPRYRSPRWRRCRISHLSENPLCVHCLERGVTTPATVVDHIKQVRLDGDFWDPTNWQSLCDVDHNRKRAKERGTINYAKEKGGNNGASE